MITITKDNIIPYLKEHIPSFDDTVPVHVSMIGEGSEEEDGDGYVNHIFRVDNGKDSYVLKQGLPLARVSGEPMDMMRNHLEYDVMRIRYSIVPEYKIFMRQHPHIPAWDLDLYALGAASCRSRVRGKAFS